MVTFPWALPQFLTGKGSPFLLLLLLVSENCSLFHCRRITRPGRKQRAHSTMDNFLSLSVSHSNSFLPHFLPRLTCPRCFFMRDVRNSFCSRCLSLFLSRRLNFQINTWLSVRKVPRRRRSPDLALRRWLLIKFSLKQKTKDKICMSLEQTKSQKILTGLQQKKKMQFYTV